MDTIYSHQVAFVVACYWRALEFAYLMNWRGVSAYFIISSASIWCGVVFQQFYVLMLLDIIS